MKTRAKVSTFLAAVLFALTASLTSASVFAQDASAPAASAPAAEAAAPAAPSPEASVPAAEAPKTEAVDQYSLTNLIKNGTLVDQATLVIMVLMSIGSWYILVTKIIDLTKLNGQAKDARKFWKAANVNAGLSSLKEGSPYRFIADSAISASQHHEGALLEQIDLNSWVTMSIQRSVDKVSSRLGEGLTFLATVGSTAPFIGLFGTVMGIYHALIAIGTSGNSSIDKVAGPVGSALIMTAIGLFVAVPAVLGYNYLLRRNKAAMEEVRAFGADLHAVVLSGAMSKASANK
ncbi:MotA/TolQ/ExbB proton channel family protein [Undibacterium cyanobacteriorum]|uniref:Biopolymer transport protein ExbB n=1 Tax=Undibacterium cyanobacteriorum TaxID=3073561 RepID=A0ABY9RFZ0_9BURK|nr:MotA/TolQ/ExbB proton channel family protein [Undibacterium sp. 20NA77.5]WMW79569.1 MotA/TolQ/ExbB proton channel family protein [Undibacterium sp. 20NA77.5]